LTGDVKAATKLMQPFPAKRMSRFAVSTFGRKTSKSPDETTHNY